MKITKEGHLYGLEDENGGINDNTPTSLQQHGQISCLRYGPVFCARVGQIAKFSNR